MNPKHIALFDKYLDGQLSGKWKSGVEEKIALDPEFKVAFTEHKMARSAITMEGRKILKRDLGRLDKGFDENSYRSYSSNRFKSGRFWILIIIALGLTAGVIYYLNFMPSEVKQEMIPTESNSSGEQKVIPILEMDTANTEFITPDELQQKIEIEDDSPELEEIDTEGNLNEKRNVKSSDDTWFKFEEDENNSFEKEKAVEDSEIMENILDIPLVKITLVHPITGLPYSSDEVDSILDAMDIDSTRKAMMKIDLKQMEKYKVNY